MGRLLYEASETFARSFDAVCAEIDPRLPRPLREILWVDPDAPDAEQLAQTQYTQPAMFAIEVSAYRMFENWGLRPNLLGGHSIGEVAAAHVAGVLSLADAATLITARGRLMQELPAGGAMIALEATEHEVLTLLAGRPDAGVAAVNGARAVVVSGTAATVESVAAQIAALGRRTTKLQVSHAFHSPLMEPMLDSFREVVETLTLHRPRIPIVSTVLGRLASDDELRSPEYWVDHVSRPVRFADAVAALHAEGTSTFLELGPGSALSAAAREVLSGVRNLAFLSAMRRGDEEDAAMSSLAGLHLAGTEVDWRSVLGPDARPVDLPTYAFQRKSYWVNDRTVAPSGTGDDDARDEQGGRQTEETDDHVPTSLAGRLAGLTDAQQEHVLLDMVRTSAAIVLGHIGPSAVDPESNFKDLGFDSMSSVELSEQLSTATGLSLQSSLLFNYPTPAELAAFLRSALLNPEVAGPTVATTARLDEPIAVVAMSCRFPGGIRSPEDLWDVVAHGTDATSDFPVNRGWDLAALYDPASQQPGTSLTGRGGFLHEADQFDADFFGINPRKRPPWTRSSDCCWRTRGRPSSGPASGPRPCAASR
ncbi:hypothetical protein GCM10027610_026130 [Dactylosporangium cerinum]